MRKIKNFIYHILLKLNVMINYIENQFLGKNSKKITIASSLKFKNKIKEDVILQKYFIKKKVKCNIEAWEQKKEHENVLIKTVWGYDSDSDNFINYINNLKNVINPKENIINNIDKEKTYNILKENKISAVETTFYNSLKDYTYNGGKIVIKPVISESGNNTYIIDNTEKYQNVLKKKLHNIMIQPYLENIKDGEESILVIDNEIIFGVIRYPGIFTKYQKEEYIKKENIRKELIKEVDKILNINEYNNNVFMRIDFIGNLITEVELIDPFLFLETIPDKNYKKEVYKKLVDTIIKRLK